MIRNKDYVIIYYVISILETTSHAAVAVQDTTSTAVDTDSEIISKTISQVTSAESLCIIIFSSFSRGSLEKVLTVPQSTILDKL